MHYLFHLLSHPAVAITFASSRMHNCSKPLLVLMLLFDCSGSCRSDLTIWPSLQALKTRPRSERTISDKTNWKTKKSEADRENNNNRIKWLPGTVWCCAAQIVSVLSPEIIRNIVRPLSYPASRCTWWSLTKRTMLITVSRLSVTISSCPISATWRHCRNKSYISIYWKKLSCFVLFHCRQQLTFLFRSYKSWIRVRRHSCQSLIICETEFSLCFSPLKNKLFKW